MVDAEDHSRSPTSDSQKEDVYVDAVMQNGQAEVTESAPNGAESLNVKKPAIKGSELAEVALTESGTTNGTKDKKLTPKVEQVEHSGSNGVDHSPHQSNKVMQSVEPNDLSVQPVSPQKSRNITQEQSAEIESNRLAKDMSRLKQVLGEVSHEAAQNVLRENWRTFLFDPPNESHVAFVLRAGLKNSTPGILSRVIKDDNVFKQPFVEAASNKPALRRRILETATPEEMFQYISVDLLESIVAAGIKSMHVKKLVAFLAQGNRLGFEESDVQIGNSEQFTPNAPPPSQQHHVPHAQPYMSSQPQAQQSYPSAYPYLPHPQSSTEVPQISQQNNTHGHSLPVPLPSNDSRNSPPTQQHGTDSLLDEQYRQHAIRQQQNSTSGDLTCPDCGSTCPTLPGFQQHLTKKPCAKPKPLGGWKFTCGNCLQGFTTKQGNDYHFLKRVCLGDDDSIHSRLPQAPPGFMPASAAPPPSGMPTTVSPSPYGVPPPRQTANPTLPSTSSWLLQSNVPPGGESSGQNHTSPFTAANAPRRLDLENDTASPKPRKKKSSLAKGEVLPFSNSTMSTPQQTTRKQAPRAPDDVRVDPSQLPPEKLAALNRELADVDLKYESGIAEIPADWSEAAKESKRMALKNANSSRKSQIRKSYGVTLRMRERDKAARNSLVKGVKNTSSPLASATASPVPTTAGLPHSRGDRPLNNQSPLVNHTIVSGFSPVNAARVVPPPSGGYGPYNPPAQVASTGSMSVHQPSGFAPRSIGAYPRLDMDNNVRHYNGPEGRIKPVENGHNSLPNPHSSATSGASTPSSTSNPGLKRRHEDPEHEKRPGSGQGGYSGSVPNTLPSIRTAPWNPAIPNTYAGIQSHGSRPPSANGASNGIDIGSENAASKLNRGDKGSGAQNDDKAATSNKSGGFSGQGKRAIINLTDSDAENNSTASVKAIPAASKEPKKNTASRDDEDSDSESVKSIPA